MIKALVLVSVFLLSSWSYSWSYSFDDFRVDLQWTVGKSVIPGYYRNFRNGTSNATALSSVFSFKKYFHAAIGGSSQFSGNTGEGVGGGVFRADQLIGDVFPEVREYIDKVIPASAKNFLDKFYFGYVASWDFERGRPGHGIFTGIEIPF